MNGIDALDKEYTGNGQWTAILAAIEDAYNSPIKSAQDPAWFVSLVKRWWGW